MLPAIFLVDSERKPIKFWKNENLNPKLIKKTTKKIIEVIDEIIVRIFFAEKEKDMGR